MLFAYLNSRTTFWFFQVAVLVYFISLTVLVGVSRFSPDSWSYFELSKSIFSENFYTFNTYRSYFSLERSTSFPFGFPVLLALMNSQFGWDPKNAAYVNGPLAALAFFLIFQISRRFQLGYIPAIALGVAFVFWPGFLDEVVGGRAYPAALVTLLLGLLIQTKSGRLWTIFLGALLVGVSTNVRFDFIFGAWASMVLVLLYFQPTVRAFLISQIGFVMGSVPWVVYSAYYFKTLWVSDNSWVSLASRAVLPGRQAFVTDFPAASIGTIFSEPMIWSVRILRNVLRLMEALFIHVQDYPLLPILLASGVLFLPFRYVRAKLIVGLSVLFVLSLALIPFVLSGYFDQRYFSLFFLAASLGLLAMFSVRGAGRYLDPVLSVLTLMVVVSASLYWFGLARDVKSNMEKYEKELHQIHSIASCHDEEPGVTYFFARDFRDSFVFRYGALTGHRVAVRPWNLDWFESESVEWVEYFSVLGPNREIKSVEFESCKEFFARNPFNGGGDDSMRSGWRE
jgi:hypothetical protein